MLDEDDDAHDEMSVAQRRVHFLRVMRKYNPAWVLAEMAAGLEVTQTELETYLTDAVELPEEMHNRIGPWMLRRCVGNMPEERRLRADEFGFLLNHFVAKAAEEHGFEIPGPDIVH
jgi:hypothetical protein